MVTIARSPTYVLILILGAISTMGAIVAGQQYFSVLVQKEMALIRHEQDESFLIVMKSVRGESDPQLDKELALQKVIIKGADSSAGGMIRQLEIRAIADLIAWCVVLVISVWGLFLNDRKQAEQGKKRLG